MIYLFIDMRSAVITYVDMSFIVQQRSRTINWFNPSTEWYAFMMFLFVLSYPVTLSSLNLDKPEAAS